MATSSHPKHESPTTLTNRSNLRPDLEPIDPRHAEFVYDANLDELTLRWVDRHTRTYRYDISRQYAALINPETNRTVGFVIERFTLAMANDPSLACALPYATRLVDDRIIAPEPRQTKAPPFRDRLRVSLRTIFARSQKDADMRGLIRTVEHAVGPC